jgi:hypothetical protein
MGILALLCELIVGHRLGAWVKMPIPENPRLRFEHAQCRVCRSWLVRPGPIDWMAFNR